MWLNSFTRMRVYLAAQVSEQNAPVTEVDDEAVLLLQVMSQSVAGALEVIDKGNQSLHQEH